MMLVKLRNWWKASFADGRGPGLVRLSSADRFRVALDVERNRADRGGQPFALVVFRFSGEHDPDRFRLAGRLEQRLRAVDHAGWLDDERVGVILTNTLEAGARTFAGNIVQTGGEPIVCRYEVYVYPAPDSSCQPPRTDHREDRTTARQPGGTLVATRAMSGIEQRVTTAVDLMQELCAAEIAASRDDRPCDSHAADQRTNAARELKAAAALAEHAQPLAPLFAAPLPIWKRAIDIVGAVVALVLFSPILLLAAVLVKLTSVGPVIFRQQRVGLGGRLFTMYKFRTMFVDAEARQAELRRFSEQDGPAFKMTNDPRITRIGRYLRKSCVDELPQLWNVLKGDMTLVGPRPLDAKETSQITGWQRRRIDVTPGLTCIWQIDGKSRVPFVEWMRMDIRYLRARSLGRDLKLIARTVKTVVLHRGSG